MPGKRGAPFGNRNAAKGGARTQRQRDAGVRRKVENQLKRERQDFKLYMKVRGLK
jgi:hypothetical protein